MRCLRILRIENLQKQNIAFCIAPPADAGGSFVCRGITVGFFVCVNSQNVIELTENGKSPADKKSFAGQMLRF